MPWLRRGAVSAPRVRAAALCAALLCAAPAARAQSGPSLPTPGETTGYQAFTRVPEAAAFLGRLAAASPAVAVDTPAADPQGRPILRVRLREPGARGESAERARVLVLAAQHGDEHSGKEAALRVARELTLGELRPLLEELDVVLLPMLNPAGVERGTRADAAGLDLNRDHGRLRSPATRAAHRTFAALRPHVVLDLHELGPSGYDVQVGLPTHPNADSVLVAYARYRLLPHVARALAEHALTYGEYVVRVAEEEGGESFWVPGEMDANHARNAFALRGALAFLVEVSSHRGTEGLEARTEAHYRTTRALLEAIAARAPEVAATVEERRRRMEGPPPLAGEPVALRARHAPDSGRPTLARRARSPEGAVVLQVTDRWRPRVRTTLTLQPAERWVLAPAAEPLARLLVRHGFRVERVTAPATAPVGRYPRAGMPELVDGEPCGRAAAALVWEETRVEEGSFVVSASQPGAALLATLVEPWSADAPLPAEPPADRYHPVSRLGAPFGGGMEPWLPEAE